MAKSMPYRHGKRTFSVLRRIFGVVSLSNGKGRSKFKLRFPFSTAPKYFFRAKRNSRAVRALWVAMTYVLLVIIASVVVMVTSITMNFSRVLAV